MTVKKHAMHRRTLLRAAGAGALALTAKHPKPVASRQESVTLDFWNGLTGPDGQIMEQLVEQYLDENPHVTINQQQIQWVDFYTKMFTAIPSGEGPEMAIMHTYEVPRFADQNLVVPIPTEEIEAVGLDPDDFFEQAWEGGAHEGERYALPVDIHCLGLYLNNKLFQNAGLWEGDAPIAPTNMEEFLEAAETLTQGNEWGVAWSQRHAWHFQNLLWQNGGRIFSEDGEPTLDTPEAFEVGQFYQDLHLEHEVTPAGITGNPIDAFRTGEYGMMFHGGWNIPGLQETEIDFTLVPVPQWFEEPAVWAGSHQFVLPTQRDEDENKRRAALEFFGWLSDHTIEWSQAGHVPARRSLVDSEEFQALTPQAVLASQFERWRFQPSDPRIIEVETRLPEAVEAIFLGQSTPEEALTALNEEIERIRL